MAVTRAIRSSTESNRSGEDAPAIPVRFEPAQAENRRPCPWTSPDEMVAAAESGEPSAMYTVGIFVKNGMLEAEETGRDWPEWLSAAARAGHILAQDALAVAHNHAHEPVPHDPAVAARLFAAAADRDHAPSLYELGILMQEGRGTGRDLAHARLAFERAAVRGHVPARLRWARMASRGEGGDCDLPGARRALLEVLEAGEESVAAHAAQLLALEYVEESLLGEDLEWYRLELQEAKTQAWSLLKSMRKKS